MSLKLVTVPTNSCEGCVFLIGPNVCTHTDAYLPKRVRLQSCTRWANEGKNVMFVSDVPDLQQRCIAARQVYVTSNALNTDVRCFRRTLIKEVR